ncbi:hypothetical protein WD019_20610 [Fictibacillus sp. Mic-4]|uniref:hypothetical protein n=1 Tax=Fictibacillus TaxID=1329200 RepID=UPI0003F679ED|nr:hypothetical protein [Fictibacillus gelatini]
MDNRQVWLIRPYPQNKNRMKEFLRDSIVAVGWKSTGDLKGASDDEIKTILYNVDEESYNSISALATLKMMANRIKIDDYIIAPEDHQVYIGVVKSDYYYSEEQQEYPHQRKVEWIPKPILRSQLPESLRRSTKVPKTSACLTQHLITIEHLLESNHVPETYPYKMEDLYEKSCQVLSRQLDHPDPMVQLKAAQIILEMAKKS